MQDKINKLSEVNKKLFKRSCVAHVMPRVEAAVNKNPSDEALECIRLVRLWLKDEEGVSAEELRSAADAAVYGAAGAAYAAARSVDARSVADAAWSADAAEAAARKKEQQWQERLLEKLLQQQDGEEKMNNQEIKKENKEQVNNQSSAYEQIIKTLNFLNLSEEAKSKLLDLIIEHTTQQVKETQQKLINQLQTLTQ